MSSSYQKALDAGYSEEEIAEFLSQKDKGFKQKYEKAIESGHSPKEILEFVQKKKEPSRFRSIISAPIKGAIKEAIDITNIPGLPRGPLTSETQKKIIEKILPTQEKRTEKGLERVGKLGVLAASGGEGLLGKGVRTGLGALVGQTAEELGAPEFAQNLAELSAFMVPKFGSKLVPTKSQKDAVEFLRKKGLSDKEITPLIQEEKKLRRLGKFATKSEKTAETLSEVHEKLGQGYEDLKDLARNKSLGLAEHDIQPFRSRFEAELNKISPRFKRLLKDDIQDFENGKMGFNDFIDFWQDINATVKGQTGGKAVLNKLKVPLQEGLNKIDPNLAKEFNQLNEFYSKKAKVGKLLAPKQLDDLLQAGEIYGIIGSIATGNFKFLKNLLGITVAKNITNQLLTNPKLQNISNQMLKSINDNRLPQALKLYEVFQNNLSIEPSDQNNTTKRE